MSRPSRAITTRALAAGGVFLGWLLTGQLWAAKPPTDIQLSNKTILEYSPSRTLIGYLSVTDPDSPQNHIFELVDGPGSDDNKELYIIGSELRLAVETTLDFELHPNTYWLARIRATDVTGLSVERTFVIDLIDDREEDFDNDGLTEAEEEDTYGTSDLLYDTDGDGVGDAAEIAIGTSPTDPNDWPQTSLVAWGRSRDGELAVPQNGSPNLLVTAQKHSLTMNYSGVIKGWGGYNGYGQISPPGSLVDVIALAAGGDQWVPDSGFSLALRRDGSVVEWGYNRSEAIQVSDGLDDVVGLAAGRAARIALRADGTVVTWGDDPFGNIQPPDGLGDVVAVSAGGYRCLALRGDGTVVEWGMNFDGQKWHEARAPAGLRDVVAISAGRFHNLALKNDGTVAAWGYGLNGQTQVPAGLNRVVAVAAGGFHSLALSETGSVIAWGLNSSGQCNIPGPAKQEVHVIAAGSEHSLAIRRGAGYPRITSPAFIHCTPGVSVSHPVTVTDPGGIPLVFSAMGLPPGLSIHPQTGLISGAVTRPVRRSVQVRVLTAYGLLTQGIWVQAIDGNSPQGIFLTPAELKENSRGGSLIGSLTVQDADAGDVHTFEWVDGPGSRDNSLFRIEGSQLLLDRDLERDFEQDPAPFTIRLRVWDEALNSHEEVISIAFLNDPDEDADGDGLTEAQELALEISDRTEDSDGDGFGDGLEVSLGTSPSDAESVPGGRLLIEWGAEPFAGAPTASDGSGLIDIAVGGAHTLLLGEDGTVRCRGSDEQGQCTPPPGLQDVVAVAAGRFHSMALRRDGTVIAWGDNSAGQCDVPSELSGVVAISAGGYHSLALRQDGTVSAWGYDAYGQATPPSQLQTVVAIAAGGFHSLALKDDGTVVAWGSDWQGACQVPGGLDGITSIAAGGYHSLVRRNDGTVVAWGDWQWGQTTVPKLVDDVIEVAAGWRHNLVLHADGSVTTWGYGGESRRNPPDEAQNVRRIAAGETQNYVIRQDAGFPGFADLSPIVGSTVIELERTLAINDAHPLAYSAIGLPEGLALDADTGRISGFVSNAMCRAIRIMADTDRGVLSQVYWLETRAGLPPLQITLDTDTVMENAPAGTLVGVLRVIDPDQNDIHYFQMDYSDGALDNYRFAISGNNLVTLIPMNADYEVGDPYLQIRVRAVDSGGNSYSRDLVIHLLDDRNEDADRDGAAEWMEEDIFGTSDRAFDDFATADADKDGMPSLLEYAFNLDPRKSDPITRLLPGAGSTAGLPAVSVVQAGPADFRLRIEYIRRMHGALAYAPQFASQLNGAAWTDASAREVVTPMQNGWERCVVEDTLTSADAPRRFGRVAIRLNGASPEPDADGDGIPRSIEVDHLGTSDDVADNFITSDIDGDGLPGIIEYAFNLDPVKPNPHLILSEDGRHHAGLPFIRSAPHPSGQMRLCIEYVRRIGSPLTYRAQFSSTISGDDWTPADDSLLESQPIAPGWLRCKAWDTAPSSALRSRFGRVAISWCNPFASAPIR